MIRKSFCLQNQQTLCFTFSEENSFIQLNVDANKESAETAQFFWTEPQFQAAKFQWES